ncbi:MAG: hypothetical protein EXS50_00345 [Candidatus Taylorbacteria bacterium]|nr:hypothetical protein [Candidatus Taylorbacteria bacterium]
MIIDIVKVFIPSMLSFVIGLALSLVVSHYLYKYKLWKKKPGKVDMNGNPTVVFNELHKEKETGTPRMGGIIIWLSVLITISILWGAGAVFPNSITSKLDILSRNQTWIPLLTLLLGAFVGLIDDILEIKGVVSGGLPLRKRLVLVTLISLFCALWFYFKLNVDGIGGPYIGEIYFGWLFVPFFVLLTIALYSGGVIDGVDGLAGGVFAIMFGAYAGIAFYLQQINLAAFCAVVVGGTLAFLWFNIPPARYYMSETGSMALTITLAVVATMTDTLGGGHGIIVLPIIALPLLVTSFSNIIQILSKKFRKGKKVFLVAPLHHHFEAKGWPSYKVTMRYWVISVICAIIGMTIALIG